MSVQNVTMLQSCQLRQQEVGLNQRNSEGLISMAEVQTPGFVVQVNTHSSALQVRAGPVLPIGDIGSRLGRHEEGGGILVRDKTIH